MATTYYVYIYFDPRTRQPFYVGYGHGTRAYQHLRLAKYNTTASYHNPHKTNKIKALLREGVEPHIKIVEDNLTKQDAQELEIFLIEFIGRRGLNTGPLTNLTSGGDGGDTWTTNPNKHTIMERIKQARLGKRWWTDGVVSVYAKTPPFDHYTPGVDEHRKAISRANRQKGADIQSTKHWVNNGTEELMVLKTNPVEAPWVVGRLLSLDGKRPNPKGKNWFNDGGRDYFLHKDDPRSFPLKLGRLSTRGPKAKTVKPL